MITLLYIFNKHDDEQCIWKCIIRFTIAHMKPDTRYSRVLWSPVPERNVLDEKFIHGHIWVLYVRIFKFCLNSKLRSYEFENITVYHTHIQHETWNKNQDASNRMLFLNVFMNYKINTFCLISISVCTFHLRIRSASWCNFACKDESFSVPTVWSCFVDSFSKIYKCQN